MRISDWSSDVCSSDLLSHSVTGLVLCKKSVRSWLCVAAKGASSINAGPPPMFSYIVASLGAGASRMAGPTPWIIDKDGQDARRHAHATLRNRDAIAQVLRDILPGTGRSEEHTPELQSLMRIPCSGLC